MDENEEKLIQAARNAREKKPNTEVTVEGQVSELVDAANEKLQRATKNSVRDALRTYDEVLASGAQGEYLVPLLVNRAIALDALGECSAAAESVPASASATFAILRGWGGGGESVSFGAWKKKGSRRGNGDVMACFGARTRRQRPSEG